MMADGLTLPVLCQSAPVSINSSGSFRSVCGKRHNASPSDEAKISSAQDGLEQRLEETR